MSEYVVETLSASLVATPFLTADPELRKLDVRGICGNRTESKTFLWITIEAMDCLRWLG